MDVSYQEELLPSSLTFLLVMHRWLDYEPSLLHRKARLIKEYILMLGRATSEEERKDFLKGCLPKQAPPWNRFSAVGPEPEREIKAEDGHVCVALNASLCKGRWGTG